MQSSSGSELRGPLGRRKCLKRLEKAGISRRDGAHLCACGSLRRPTRRAAQGLLRLLSCRHESWGLHRKSHSSRAGTGHWARPCDPLFSSCLDLEGGCRGLHGTGPLERCCEARPGGRATPARPTALQQIPTGWVPTWEEPVFGACCSKWMPTGGCWLAGMQSRGPCGWWGQAC